MQMKIWSRGGSLSALRVPNGLMGGGMGRILHFGGDRAEDSAVTVLWKAFGPPGAPQAFWSQWAPFGGGGGGRGPQACLGVTRALGARSATLHICPLPPFALRTF